LVVYLSKIVYRYNKPELDYSKEKKLILKMIE
jgi:hypothetical protein